MDIATENLQDGEEKLTALLRQLIALGNNSPNSVMSIGIVNGSLVKLDAIENMGISKFILQQSIPAKPRKLYRYYPNKWITESEKKRPVNYSLESLKSNTVYMQSPMNFDDIYDSRISLDWMIYMRFKLRDYIRLCGLEYMDCANVEELRSQLSQMFFDYYSSKGTICDIFPDTPTTEIEQLKNKLFLIRVETNIKSNNSSNWNDAISDAIYKGFDEDQNMIRNRFRISCFTTSPYSQLMWASYADQYSGFCVEYDIDSNNRALYEAYCSLFPVIYCKSRPDITEYYMKNMYSDITDEISWHFLFHGTLRKSIDWFHQCEWRLLKFIDKDSSTFSISFFPASKVYFGPRMVREERDEIMDICKGKNIPFVGVLPSQASFDMGECQWQCDSCKFECWKS